MKDMAIAIDEFVAALQERINNHWEDRFPNLIPPIIDIDYGHKYARIVKVDQPGGSKSVHCFIDLSNGDILKSASWKAPAKHARGNIFADDKGMSAVSEYGARYLR